MRQQMYKIYVNSTPVFLTTRQELPQIGIQPNRRNLVNFYAGKKKQIHHFIDLLEKNTHLEAVVLWSFDVEQLWQDFQACFQWVEAAGGVVRNHRGEVLVFFRRGFWDLPKGKIDPGETPEQAALREVREETGLQHLTIGKTLTPTFHTYLREKVRYLKKTWWFEMFTSDSHVVPQIEEDIEKIEWVDAQKWLATNPNLYPSLRQLID